MQKKSILSPIDALEFPHDLRRISGDHCAGGDVPANYAPGADHSPFADRNPLQDEGVHTHEHIVFNEDGRSSAGVEIFGAPFRRQRVEVRVNDGGIAADLDPIANRDAVSSDERRARKAAVASDLDVGVGATGR